MGRYLRFGTLGNGVGAKVASATPRTGNACAAAAAQDRARRFRRAMRISRS